MGEGKDMEGKTFMGLRPLETPEKRPDLYCIMLEGMMGDVVVSDGIWLRKAGGKVAVKSCSPINPFPYGVLDPLPPGTFTPGAPAGPQYTGPIDDETMANILIYGG
jgi:hypothetical protein